MSEDVGGVIACRYAAVLCLAVAAGTAAETATTATWEKRFGGSDFDRLRALTTDAAGNIYAAGTTKSLDLPARGVFAAPRGTNLFRWTMGETQAVRLASVAGGSVLAIGTNAVSPAIVYVSTSSGLMRTADGGATWSMVHLPAFPSATAAVRSIAVDPENAAVAYVAASAQGLLRSVDNGNTWVSLLGNFQTLSSVLTVTIDPVTPTTIFATGYESSEPVALRSQDAGQTWTVLPAPLTQVFADSSTAGTLYGFAALELLRSPDSGNTWAQLQAPPGCVTPQSIQSDARQPGIYLLCNGTLFRSTNQGDTWDPLEVAVANGEFLLAETDDPVSSNLCAVSLYGNSYCSTDNGATWNRGVTFERFVTTVASSNGVVFAGTSHDRDGFVAKFGADGNLLWASYLGGSGDDEATAITVDGSGNVYIAGTTQSSDFPVTSGAYDGGSVNDRSGFVVKLSPDGSQVAYAARMQLDGEISGLAVDQSAGVCAAGWTRAAIATTPASVSPGTGIIPSCAEIGCADSPESLGVTRAFVSKLTAGGDALSYSTYLGDWADSGNASAVAIDPDGSVYVAGSVLWKLNPAADRLLFATVLSGYGFRAAALDAGGNLITGGVSGANLYTTHGVWKSWPDAFDGFLAKYSPAGELLASTSMGGAVGTIGLAGDGTIVTGGSLNGGSYYTMSMLQGPFGRDWFARVSADFSQLDFSSFVGQDSAVSALRVGGLPGGALVAGGSYYNGIPYAEPPTADVLLWGAAAGSTDNPRIDSILNEADPSPNPLSPGERIVVWGEGIDQGVGILIGPQEGQILDVRPGELTAVVPASLDTTAPADVFVMVDGKRSSMVHMPVAAASPVLYNGDNYASSQALILNEDGTQNSASQPAARGSIVSLAVNGAGRFTASGSTATLDNPIDIAIANHPAPGVDAILMPAPGLKGDVLFIRVRVPDDVEVPGTPVEVPVDISPVRYLSGARPATMWVK